MTKEYIEVEKARDYIHNGDGTPMQKLFADLCVLNSPRATDVAEVKHGYWEFIGDKYAKCSNCGTAFETFSIQSTFQCNNIFCRHCGAIMDGENK